ncbi:MAG: hypothetical protein M1822_007244 [Bathelium mastoideum]|nr:MAG: hypothetical protein M1822_007244 [Bathelium mastoideum]
MASAACHLQTDGQSDKLDQKLRIMADEPQQILGEMKNSLGRLPASQKRLGSDHDQGATKRPQTGTGTQAGLAEKRPAVESTMQKAPESRTKLPEK